MNLRFYNFPVFLASDQLNIDSGPVNTSDADLLVLWEENGPEQGALLAFFEKILKALQRTPEQDTLLATLPPQQTIDLNSQIRKWHITYVLIFGIAPSRLGMQVSPPLYQPFRLGGTTYLWADPLLLIQQERAAGKDTRSRPLWTGLQQMLKTT